MVVLFKHNRSTKNKKTVVHPLVKIAHNHWENKETEEITMSNITEMELQNLRHLLLANETEEKKYQSYAEQATDPNVKQYFQKSVQSATQNKSQLLQFLN